MKALVIDDNDDCRENVVMRLRKGLRHECDEAGDLECAMDMFNENIYDYVILDMRIPSCFGGVAMVCNGRSMLTAIRSRFKPSEVPVIVLTGEIAEPQDAANLISQYGANDFLVKASEGDGRSLEDAIMKCLEDKTVRPEVSDNTTASWLKVHRSGDLLVWTTVSKRGEEKSIQLSASQILSQVLACIRAHNDGPNGVEHSTLADEVAWRPGRYTARLKGEQAQRRGRIRPYVVQVSEKLGMGHEYTVNGIRFTRPE